MPSCLAHCRVPVWHYVLDLNGDNVGSIDIITAVLPSRSQYLADTDRSVQAARAAASRVGWSVRWIIAIDGPGQIPVVDADTVVRLPTHRGTAVARNLALARSTCEWSAPLDADDTLDAVGFTSLLERMNSESGQLGWFSVNRRLMTGEKTPHWRSVSRNWRLGELAENWNSPFPFHPNSIFLRTSLALSIGGWPALPTNEDLALCLQMGELAEGASYTDMLTYYRVWDGQEISADTYKEDKDISFDAIERTINATRVRLGRTEVSRPAPGPAFGAIAIES